MPNGVYETTAAEVSRNFGQWQDKALQSPVRVTHHGRPRVVIVSATEFERLVTDQEDSYAAPSWTSAAKDAECALNSLLEGMAEGFIALDANLRITAVNSVVEMFLGMNADELVGRPVNSIGDQNRAEVFVDRYRWVLRTGEAATFDSTGYIRRERMLRVRAFPFRGGVGVIFTNRTELETLRESQSAWAAERAALAGHPAIATASLNTMGFVTEANPAFLDFIGFAGNQLNEVRLTDLASAAHRAPLSKALNDLLQQRVGSLNVDAEFLTRDNGRRTMSLSLTPRLRDLALDGLTLVGLAA